jgi:hypothetical protein
MNARYGKGSLTATAVALAVLCAFSTGANSQDAKEGPSKSALQKMYMSYLADEGFKPEIDSDGDVRYKSEGKVYCIIIDAKDSLYFRLVLANIWKIENETERQKVLVAVDYSNAKSKVSKAYIVKDNVWVCIELFVAKPEDFKPLFSRSSSALANGVTNFVQKMRE